MYIHTLPTTGAISFSDIFLSSSTLASQLADATASRARLRAILKQNRKDDNDGAGGESLASSSAAGTGAGASTGDEVEALGALHRDWRNIVQAVDDYLPHLLGIYNCIQTDDLLLRHEPEFSWRTTLTPSLLRAPPRITLRGIRYELSFVLLLSGMSLYNLSSSLAHSLGPYEHDLRLSNEERKSRDERLRFAADTLCRAAGVFAYLSDTIIPQWENAAGSGVAGRPADVTKEVTRALSNLAMAEAETLAIRKLLSPALSAAADTITPGPPLSSSHPSPSLLAKLHLNVATLYDSAHSMASTVSSKASVPRLQQEMAVELDARRSAVGDDDGQGLEARDGIGGSSSRKGKGALSKLKSLGRKSDGAGAGVGGVGIAEGGPRGLSTTSGGGEDTEVAAHLLRYLSASADLSRGVAYKWLAINVGESQSSSYGEAVGFLRMAAEVLKAINVKARSSAASAVLGRAGNRIQKEPWEALRMRRDEELKNVSHWLGAYTKLNDTVTFQPIPPPPQLKSRIPSPRGALTVKAYDPPVPSFGPGSPGFLSEGLRRLAGFHSGDFSGGGTGDGADKEAGDGRGQGETSGDVAKLEVDLASLGLLGPAHGGLGSKAKGATYVGSGAYY